jgi:uncharacterized membrane protein YfhO
MTANRYNKISVFLNEDADYKKVFKKRFDNTDSIEQYGTQKLDYPEFFDVFSFNYKTHIWGLGDRYYKLAHFYYGDSQYWWVIAWFNKKPTEQHVKLGDTIKVPLPLQSVLTSYGL